MNYIRGEIGGVVRYVDSMQSNINSMEESLDKMKMEYERDREAYAMKPPPGMTIQTAQASLVMKKSKIETYEKGLQTKKNTLSQFSPYLTDINEMNTLISEADTAIAAVPAVQSELLQDVVPMLTAVALQI